MRRGFTLIEVMAVVMVLAVLAGAAAWTMTEQLRSRRSLTAIEQLTGADRTARLAARSNGGSTRLEIDLDAGLSVRYDQPEGALAARRAHPIQLPDGTEMRRVWLHLPSGKVEVRHGRVSIPYSTEGSSPTYAIELARADQAQWLVVAGLTGQTFLQQETHHVEALFTLLAAGRTDPA
ncbi:MAG: prepilin-type N-terminal cleavage/methylation domain-containing protein [Phycisphaerae bacterium]